MTLALDHLFCMVAPDGGAAARLEAAGWWLDAGRVHAGQGTRNRRLVWPEQFFELLWVADEAEARSNPLRLDRRAGWAHSGASPFGFALRGRLSEAEAADYWLYDALGFPIWIHRDNERAPERPLVFVLEVERAGRPALPPDRQPGALRSVRFTGPARASLPDHAGPAIEYAPGPHRLELHVAGAASLDVTDILLVRGA